MGRANARLFNVVRCRDCLRYINGRTGLPGLYLFVRIVSLQLFGVLLCIVLGCVGLFLGERAELWFGIPALVLFAASCVIMFWVARSQR